jgi:hypothetical protein
MNDEYQREHDNTLENEDQYHGEAPETPDVGMGTMISSESEVEKTVIRGPSVSTVQAVIVPDNSGMLLGSEEIQHFRARWNEIQAKFVDEPGSSVREADALVTELMTDLSQMFANQRRTLESHWNQPDVATEDLRQILMSYRSFFNHLLI